MQQISAGGTASGTTVRSGGILQLDGMGAAQQATLNSGYVIKATTSATLTTADGSAQIMSGAARNLTLNSGGYLRVEAGHTAADTTVNDGGQQWISAGGTALGTVVNDAGTELVYGAASGTAVQSGGKQQIYVGGKASQTTVDNGGTQWIFAEGTAMDTTVNSGGVQCVHAQGTASGTTVQSGGVQQIDDRGTAFDTVVNDGGLQWISAGGAANGTVVNNGGKQQISAGGAAMNTVVNASGTQWIENGGTAIDATVGDGGHQYILAEGAAAGTTVNGGGAQWVLGGGTAAKATVNRDGLQYIYAGGIATETTVNSGGWQQLSDGGAAFGAEVNGGGQFVGTGAAASGTIVNDGGAQWIFAGGVASGTQVNSGGLQTVLAGGTAIDGVVAEGAAQLARGAAAYEIDRIAASGDATIRLASDAADTAVGRTLRIGELSGSAAFVINTDLTAGQSDRIEIAAAADSAANTLRVNYDPKYNEGKAITGQAQFAQAPTGVDFTAQSSEYGAYEWLPTLVSVGASENGGAAWYVTGIAPVNGGKKASETVQTAADAAAGTALLWESEGNHLTRRLGELRCGEAPAGAWGRVYRGKQEMSLTGRDMTQTYTAMQIGTDRRISQYGGALYLGGAIGYTKGSANMARGDGDYRDVNLGVYGAWLGDKGHYVDVVARQGRLRSEFCSMLDNAAGDRVKGEADAWGTLLSVEYGRRLEYAGGGYLEPQLELSYARTGAADYTAGDGTRLRREAVNALVGRLGVAAGIRTERTNCYAAVSLARRFNGEARASGSSHGLAAVEESRELKENWLEFALGLTGKSGKNSDYYLELSRTTGDKAKTSWLLNAGLRWGF